MRGTVPLLLAALAAACARPGPASRPGPAALAVAESLYLATRDVRDRIDVLDASGADTTPAGVARGTLVRRYDSLRHALALRLGGTDSASLRAADTRAFRVMRRTLDRDLGETPAPMRGQLVDEPGYMMNYAAGAIVIAAIRERTRTRHGAFSTGDPGWYGWVAPRLYRFGLERPTREVLENFLGGPVTPAALLRDLRRLHSSGRPGCGAAC
jgi:hypothetical protein